LDPKPSSAAMETNKDISSFRMYFSKGHVIQSSQVMSTGKLMLGTERWMKHTEAKPIFYMAL